MLLELDLGLPRSKAHRIVPRRYRKTPVNQPLPTLPALPDVPGGWTIEEVDTGGQLVRLAIPADAEAILEDVVAFQQNCADDYMPYWIWLWPAARAMAGVAGKLPLPASGQVLELGCGLGLVGIAAALAGHDVVWTDYREESVQTARHNAALNGLCNPEVRRLDWRDTPSELFASVIACDVLYEERDHDPILDFVDALLTDDGECWIGDPGRQRATEFISTASERFHVRLFDQDVNEVLVPSVNDFFLIRLRRHG